MKKKIFIVVTLAMIFLGMSSSMGQDMKSKMKTEDLKTKVQAISDKMARANVAGDMETVYSLYADDIVLMPNYGPMIKGKEGIKEYDEKMAESGGKIISMTLTTMDVTDLGTMVYEIGTYGMSMEIPGMEAPWADKGKYVSIYRKKKDGSLEMIVDIWNTDVNPWAAMK
jgi:uncharacterized protein (TIGR02246 family)